MPQQCWKRIIIVDAAVPSAGVAAKPHAQASKKQASRRAMVTSRIVDSFVKYFYLTHADTDELRKTAYQIRWEVYCREFRFLPKDNHLEQMERDEYDEYAQHCLLMHKPTGSAVGCARLIASREDDPATLLPFEHCCSHAVDDEIFDFSTLKRGTYGEISRLAVLSRFRRRKTDEKRPISFPDQKALAAGDRDPFPIIPLSLFLAIGSMLLRSGLIYGFAMMEPRLMRMLRRYGIIFKQIGNVVDYHGRRGPFVIHRKDMLPSLSPDVHDLSLVIRQQLSQEKG